MNNNFLKSTIFATTALGLGVGVAAPAFAQNADNGENAADIVVTARRVEERLQDVPISITVFNQEQLSNRNIVNAADLATYTPSLSANTRFGDNGSSFAIRGFTQELRTTASVGTYFADVVAPRGGPSINSGDGAGPGALFDLQNVQVLKGPQGTLFGRNTTGGAVLLVPQRPTDEFGGYAEVSAGDYNMERFQGVLNLPLSDNARLRIGMDRQMRDGYIDNTNYNRTTAPMDTGPRDFGDSNYEAYRVSFVADLTPTLENYTVASYVHSRNHGPASSPFVCTTPHDGAPASQGLGQIVCITPAFGQSLLALPGLPPGTEFTTTDPFYGMDNTHPDPYSTLNQWQLINTTKWDVSDNLTIKNIISYAEVTSSIQYDVFGTNMQGVSLATSPSFALDPVPFSFVQVFTNGNLPINSQSTFTEELQFQGRSSDARLNWQAGLYYEESDPVGLSGQASANLIACNPTTAAVADPLTANCFDIFRYMAGLQGLGDPGPAGTIGTVTNGIHYQNEALYAQGAYAITDQFKFTAGIRYTWDHTSGWADARTYTAFPYQDLNGAPLNGVFDDYGTPGATVCDLTGATMVGNCVMRETQHSEAPTWVLGVDYTPTENVLLYGKYARGYRQGSINLYAPPEYGTYAPEHVDTYEIGAKTSFSAPVRGTFNIAAFYNDFTDQQLAANNAPLGRTPSIVILNAGASKIWGVEIESNLNLFEGFNLNLSYTYLNTELTELTTPSDPDVQMQTAAGGPLAFSPKNKASVTASYRLPLPENIGRVTAAATYVYTDEQLSTTQSPYGVLPSYDLVNLNLNWDHMFGGPVDGALFVTNATDEEYTTIVEGLYNLYGADVRMVGQPRMFGARLRYRFGGEAH